MLKFALKVCLIYIKLFSFSMSEILITYMTCFQLHVYFSSEDILIFQMNLWVLFCISEKTSMYSHVQRRAAKPVKVVENMSYEEKSN